MRDIDKKIKAELTGIAQLELNVPTLEARGNDSLDFHDCSVRSIERALERAYELGRSANREWGIQLGIEIGMKRAGELMARELHNFKFPDGKIDHENDALKQYEPKDNSTFEIKTQTYGERILEREAAQRNVRRRRSNRMVAKNRKRRSKPNGTWTAPVKASKSNEDHGYDELLAEEGVYVKE